MPLSNGMQHEVEVDQRTLQYILPCYSGPFDVLRELIQNADDAGSATVELRFESRSQHTGEVRDTTKPVRKWIIRNEGAFTAEDWDRIGKIGAPNGDPTKVGTFGVGFYSVLSKSDRPLVKSGGKSLQFYKAEDGKLWNEFGPEEDSDGWTSIELELNEEETLPKLDDLAGFLISSVALLANVHAISVRLDGETLFGIERKSIDPPDALSIPEHLTRTSREKALRIDSIQRTVQTITIDAADWAFASPSAPSSSLDDDGERPGYELRHDLYTATVSIVLDEESEVRRGVGSMLKSLPDTFECKAVYLNHEQLQSFESSMNESPFSMARLFESIVPENNGRLFIGQSTHQTTGIGLHFSSHFLPTIERSAIDLGSDHITTWNKEVLWISGVLTRMIYEEDMRLPNPESERATKLGLKTMARFTFGETSPDGGVSEILQDAFFGFDSWPKSQFLVVSDAGICFASHPQLRQANELAFLRTYRTLHSDIQQSQRTEITKRFKIPRLQYEDIVEEFKTGVPPETMRQFFAWWQHHIDRADIRSTDRLREFCEQFASMGILRSRNGADIPLKDIRYFTTFPIDDDISHPESIYIDISSDMLTEVAITLFGWTPLLLLEWLKNTCPKAREIARNGDSDVGRRISRVIVQFSLSPESLQAPWDEVAELVEDIECIPTNKGLRMPRGAYLEVADVCQQLPVADVADFLDIHGVHVVDHGYQPLNRDHVERVLQILGVRDEVDWPDIVKRLETSGSETTNERLLRFLFRVYTDRNTLPLQFLADLRTKGMLCSRDHGLKPTTELYLADGDDEVQKLGLPVLALPLSGAIHRDLTSLEPAKSSSMRQLLEYLGIQSHPSLRNPSTDTCQDEDGEQSQTEETPGAEDQRATNVQSDLAEQATGDIDQDDTNVLSNVRPVLGNLKIPTSSSSRVRTFSDALTTIPDLSPHIVKSNDFYCGAGSFSDVYKRQCNTSAGLTEVAVKSFRFPFTLHETIDDISKSSATQKMIRRELGIWKRLKHPNIVPFLGITYGFGRERNVSLVSVWMANGTLRDFFEGHDLDDRLTVAHRLQLLLDIGSGLSYLHSFSFVHGDLSCNNVLFDHSYNALLTDFGYSSMVGDIPEAVRYLQMTTVRPGTVRWAAPEHFTVDAEMTQHSTNSDIYSFGNMAFFLLSGMHPWCELKRDEQVILQLSRGNKPKRPLDRPIDNDHWKLIERCWSSFDERPRAEDVVSSLQQFLLAFPSRPLIIDMVREELAKG